MRRADRPEDRIDLGPDAAPQHRHAYGVPVRSEISEAADQLELWAVPEKEGAEVLAPIAVRPNEGMHQAAIRDHRPRSGRGSWQALPDPFVEAEVGPDGRLAEDPHRRAHATRAA